MERKLAAILCADVYDYSRLTGQDEEATNTLSVYRKVIDSLIESYRGRVVNSAGDRVLSEFTSVVAAVNCRRRDLCAPPMLTQNGPAIGQPHKSS